VRVHHDEGVANHIGPESCAEITREGGGEALTGERTGQPLSRERLFSGVPTAFSSRKAIRSGASSRALDRPRVVEEPGMYGCSLHGNREISSLTTRKASGVARIGKARSRSR